MLGKHSSYKATLLAPNLPLIMLVTFSKFFGLSEPQFFWIPKQGNSALRWGTSLYCTSYPVDYVRVKNDSAQDAQCLSPNRL